MTTFQQDEIVPEVLGLHREAAIVLGYMNVAASYDNSGADHSAFLEDAPQYQACLPKLRRGGVDVAVLSFGVPTRWVNPLPPGVPCHHKQRIAGPVFEGAANAAFLLDCLKNIQEVVERAPDAAAIARSVAEIEAINAQGKTALLLHLTGAWCNGDLGVLQTYYEQGVRGIHPCIAGLRGIGGTSGDLGEEAGLTPFGVEVVREMNRLGMVVDAAHASDKAAWQMLETSSSPVISSHSWCRVLRPGDRGLPDDLMRGIADQGGVIGLFLVAEPESGQQAPRNDNFYVEFHRRIDNLWQRYGHDPYEFLRHRFDPKQWEDLNGASCDPGLMPRMRSVETVVEHIDHAVQVAGIDHVGIGPDYELGIMPRGLETAEQLPHLTAALCERSYKPEDIRKILGGNFLRVFREVIG